MSKKDYGVNVLDKMRHAMSLIVDRHEWVMSAETEEYLRFLEPFNAVNVALNFTPIAHIYNIPVVIVEDVAYGIVELHGDDGAIATLEIDEAARDE